MSPTPFRLPGGRVLTFERARIMGILNTTPDSFSDGGRFLSPEPAISRGLALLAQGADLLDLGAESTRPGSLPVAPAIQMERLLPVVRALSSQGAILSIDTSSSEVAEACLDAGAHILNDVSGGLADPRILEVASAYRAPIFLMHRLGPSLTMQQAPVYEDLVGEIYGHLQTRLEAALAAGLERSQIGLDYGLGFGKTTAHNLSLLKHTKRFLDFGLPLLVGASRKSFLGAITGLPVTERDSATLSASALSVFLGAHVVRVHEPLGLRAALDVAEALSTAD